MPLNYDTAKAIVEETHRAWNAGDISAFLRTHTDDLCFQRNSAEESDPPLIIHGKAAMEAYLRAIDAKVTGIAVIDNFQFHSGVARSRVSYFLTDRETGQTLTANFRQIVTFRGMQIARTEHFHDAARLAAFFRLIKVPAFTAQSALGTGKY
jgi:ketosteroid isomerase-like protein